MLALDSLATETPRPSIPNSSSTARDFLARERNFLINLKLAAFLAFGGIALLGRFRFASIGEVSKGLVSHSTVDYAYPLGIILFSFAIITVINATYEVFALQHKMKRQYAFTVQAAPWSRYLSALLVLVVFAATVCVLVYEE